MDLLLRILGGACLLVMVGAVLLFVVLLIVQGVLKAKLSRLADQFKYTVVHPRVHLVPQPVAAWSNGEAVEALSRPLREAGFVEAGAFGTREMDYLRLQALVHPEEHIYAAVYEHDAAGVFMDLVTFYEDGTSVTYSTAAQGGELRQRPGHLTVREPELGAAELLRRMLAERPDRPMRPATVERWPAEFERAYAESMDWRNSQPFDPEEVRRTAGRDLTAEELEELRQAHEANQYEGLNQALYEEFSQHTTTTGAEWDRVKDRLVFIHDRLSRQQLQSLFDEWYTGRLRNEADAVEPDWDLAPTPRAAFAQVNARLPLDAQFRELGEITRPVTADVYAAPEGPAFWSEEDED